VKNWKQVGQITGTTGWTRTTLGPTSVNASRRRSARSAIHRLAVGG